MNFHNKIGQNSLIFNIDMNLKHNKGKEPQQQTPIKRSQIPNQLLTNNPTKSLSNLQKKAENLYDWCQKQNYDPNIDMPKKQHNIKQQLQCQLHENSSQRTPKRKVIHLKSISKNSKSVKDGSNSVGKKYSAEHHHYTEVAQFSDNLLNNRPAIKIEIDLKGHRKSLQDTFVSSKAAAQALIRNQKTQNQLYCSEHGSKKATFVVKGRPFCDKCSVKLITKGFVAVRIKNQTFSHELLESQVQNDFKEQDLKKRDSDLRHFIEQLDKIQPVLESFGTKIDSYLGWLVEYFQFESSKLQENWSKLMTFLEKFKYHLTNNFRAQQQKCQKILSQAKQKIKQQTINLSFMRNDIVRNIDRIIDESTVPLEKYNDVMDNFKSQLQQIYKSTRKIENQNLMLPKTEIDLFRLDEEFHKSFAIKYHSEELFRQSLDPCDEEEERTDPYRLSFGKDSERVASPTFKLL